MSLPPSAHPAAEAHGALRDGGWSGPKCQTGGFWMYVAPCGVPAAILYDNRVPTPWSYVWVEPDGVQVFAYFRDADSIFRFLGLLARGGF